MSLSSIPKSLRTAVSVRDGNRCQYCSVLQAGQSSIFHVDHIIPRSKGGPTTLDNLALQCPHCSLHKSNRTQAPDPKSTQIAPLFHPLIHVWSEHFQLSDDGTITGKSSIGRATLQALCMNDLWPRSARALQISTGWIKI